MVKRVNWKNEIGQIKQYLSEGWTTDQIGNSYGVSKQRIYQVMQKFGLETGTRKRKTYLAGKPPKYYWLNKMLSAKGVDKKKRQRLLEDFPVPDKCPILGIELNYEGSGNGAGWGARSDASPSIDQIVPGGGYTVSNMQIISWRANRIKNDATPEELRLIADYMAKYESPQ